eukprot:scaffold91535_cov22-Tisochrysis_lutea.AAC.1
MECVIARRLGNASGGTAAAAGTDAGRGRSCSRCCCFRSWHTRAHEHLAMHGAHAACPVCSKLPIVASDIPHVPTTLLAEHAG